MSSSDAPKTAHPEVAELRRKIAETTRYLKEATGGTTPKVGIILGTGMGKLAEQVETSGPIAYDQIPNFPVSTVESHHGNMFIGKFAGADVMMMQGRFHVYEGYSFRDVTYPIRVMKAMGCSHAIIMNAVGSMNPLINAGDIMLVTDHINMMGGNPLIGPNDDEMGPRFPDMSEPYNREMIATGESVAIANQLRVHKGVLIAVTGPNLETAAEYRAFRRMGADCVTMSTIPEIIVAKHAGLKAMAISTITDMCLPDNLHEAKLEEIIAVAGTAEPKLSKLVTGIVEKL